MDQSLLKKQILNNLLFNLQDSSSLESAARSFEDKQLSPHKSKTTDYLEEKGLFLIAIV